MKHSDKSPHLSDTSARLDALLSDFLSKEIVAPSDPPPAAQATSMPLGDVLAEVGQTPAVENSSPAVSRAPAETQKVIPVNRTEVWESTSNAGRPSAAESGPLNRLAADQLEKSVDSMLAAPTVSSSGRKVVLGALALLAVVAGVFVWQSSGGKPKEALVDSKSSEMPRQVETPAPPEASASASSPNETQPAAGEAETAHASAATNGGQSTASRPVAALPASNSSAPSMNGVPQSTASNAAKLQQMPAPAIGGSSLPLGTIQDLQSLKPGLPAAPLPLPLSLPGSSVKGVVPDSPRPLPASPAVLLTKVQPVYPEMARKMNVEGTVHVAIVVDTAGRVTSAKALSGPPLLRGSAELAVKQWRFKPASINGKPVAGNGTVSVVFNPGRR
ncbi:MAG: TonB family protein [Acidobacteria bacterium]|nr:TonB family protein [Acidobacteriota bacterium]MCI0724827.1 TonB family protein [Acidobacteriota bacterium]